MGFNYMIRHNSSLRSADFFNHHVFISGILREIPANKTCADEKSFEFESYNQRLCICEQKKETTDAFEISKIIESVENHLNSMITHENSSCCISIRLESSSSKLMSKARDFETIKYTGVLKVQNYSYRGTDVLFDVAASLSSDKGNFSEKC